LKPKLAIIFALLILAPFAAMAWMGMKIARDERAMVFHRFDELLFQRLVDVNAIVNKVVESRERNLQKITDFRKIDHSTIRDVVRAERTVRQIFVIGVDGKMMHPPLNAPRNQSEEEFLARTRHIWESGESFFHPSDPATPSPVKKTRQSKEKANSEATVNGGDHGWYTWYWGSGINFIFWRQDTMGRVIGAELDRLTLMADIVGELPETSPGESDLADGRIQLVDSDGQPVYVWGQYEPAKDERPRVTRDLDSPLGAWRLHYFASQVSVGNEIGGGVVFGILVSIGALALIMFALAFYFVRESGREARDARQRVTFVNQVSHELKTPLTNIRMYAELLEDRIDEDDDKPRNYLDVIVSESQRLSRLIGNVLTFAAKHRNKLVVRPVTGKIDDTIRAVIDQFRPSLEADGFEIEVKLTGEGASCFDADVIGQILSNLIGNVEKYAAQTGWIKICARRDGNMLAISVEDRGPGIPASARKRIFQPFVRLSQRIAEGTSGTGIGLNISRELARLHKGDLTLEPAKHGALFKAVILAPLDTGEPL
jgi:signal transduction histidine kinase